MNPELKLVIFEEKKLLQDLLELLEKQYEAVVNKELMTLEKLTETIENAGKNLAAIEIKRRSLVKEEKFSEIIASSEDDHVKEVYEEIKSLLHNLELQKNTNDTIIKQNLFFTNKMINVIKPSKSAGTYNSYGKTR
ncbi:Flagellar biosynthesis/type III secretory pathway chaperone [Clostridium collagenovorans DSM 3089]|uniref:Flagellar biosynthesis/type III secretory pathway chaperone n=1 Tax=Clostridium collagenovorans DSM 3089 TaxID=1121306 RepID=A0A1M5WQ86_9CLOT|nr:flagellar protein FlgN [Clostridium collagenovorans]SHH89304.1 Flagellar biosynthesis/type III secretory pathway chaperone [Clostridium collagenovorans DSM 3089]